MSQLPLFEGRQPRAAHLSLTGTIADPVGQPDEALALDQDVWLVISGRASAINHKLTGKDGVLVRVQTLTVGEAHLLDPEAGKSLIASARLAAEQRREQQSLLALNQEWEVTRAQVDPDTGEIL